MGQLLRQGGRFLAIYFSDVLLWLSVAGIFEILFVFIAGALCILTLGFVFEGMKKSPVVIVLGTVVALTSTFLLYREVRDFIRPTAPAVAEKGAGTTGLPTPLELRPDTSVKPPVRHSPTTSLLPSDCATRGKRACKTNTACYWSALLERCYVKSDATFLGEPYKSPLTTQDSASLCNALNTLTCQALEECYWSRLTNRCERLRVGGGLLSGAEPTKPPGLSASCAGKTFLACLSTEGCQWSASRDRCYSPKPVPPAGR